MNDNLQALVNVSQSYGRNHDYVIAGGGNTSFKNDHHLWIKASGVSLETITEDGFVKMDRSCLDELSLQQYSNNPQEREAQIKEALHRCIADDQGKRPSVETSLHNLLKQQFVVHTHPTLVNALMCSRKSRKKTQRLFGDEVLFVEYTDPGYVLFNLVERRIWEYTAKHRKTPGIIFLENHGVFVAGDTIEIIDQIYHKISRKLTEAITTPLPSRAPEDPYLDETIGMLADKTGLSAQGFSSRLIHHYVADEQAFSKVNTAFTPDQIVYCKARYLFSEAGPESVLADYRAFEEQHGYPPKVIAMKNRGIICVEENDRTVNTVFEVYNDLLKIAFLAESFGGPKAMTAAQIAFIDQWEVENYRRKMARDK